MNIDDFIEKLKKFQVNDSEVCNFYGDKNHKFLENNLRNYLENMLEKNIDIFLIGEAPGYKGCKLTGIPFTDGIQIKNKNNEFILGNTDNYEIKDVVKENSASIIWQVLRETGLVALMWNAYPFHPHNPGESSTNRKPNAKEKKQGLEFIEDLQSIFNIPQSKIFAIGRVSWKQLNLSEDRYIRHPSFGGKTDCIKKLKDISRNIKDISS